MFRDGKNLTNTPGWCNLVHMKDKIKEPKGTIRSSISFPRNVYSSLEEIALVRRVSLAWVVRDAVEIYLKGQKEEKNVKNV